jgi:hypothetical protein
MEANSDDAHDYLGLWDDNKEDSYDRSAREALNYVAWYTLQLSQNEKTRVHFLVDLPYYSIRRIGTTQNRSNPAGPESSFGIHISSYKARSLAALLRSIRSLRISVSSMR